MTSITEFHLYRRYIGCLDRQSWTIRTNSASTDGDSRLAIDGSYSTNWITNSASETGQSQTFPYYLIIDLGSVQKFNGFVIFGNQDINNDNRPKEYHFYTGESLSHIESRITGQTNYNYKGIFT